MPTTTAFRDIDNEVAIDLATKFVTKEYLSEFYPDLVPRALTPRLLLWGGNSYGQLADNTSSHRSSPVETVSRGTNWKQVAGGSESAAAIKTDGTLWTWGANRYGGLGDNTSSSRSSPVTTTGGGTNWRQVSMGSGHLAAIKTDGTLWTCGYNKDGQLGDNTSSYRSSPVTTAGGGTNWKQVACGTLHTAAIKTDGTLWCWGSGSFGQLGEGVYSSRSSPVTTAGGGTNWKQVSAGRLNTAAIKTDETLWTWGYNIYGALGDNTTTQKNSPVTTAGGGTNWKQSAVGWDYAAGLKTDGTLWVWGRNDLAQLGTNNTSSYSSPVTITGGGTNWTQISCSYRHNAAIKTDGTLWTWGKNTNGCLGDNTLSDRSSPVTTVAGGTNWKQVAVGFQATYTIAESEGW